ncbi:MAG: O-antigen ligase family protein [Janthinobacterium lividum]
MTRTISAIASRPEFWLVCLLIWILLSASRSLGTPWAQAALTEALRWSAGIGLALAIGWSLRRTVLAGQFLVTLLGAMALAGILDSGASAQSGMVGPYHDHQLYGSVLLLLLPFSAGIALTSPQSLWRWGALAAFTAGTLCLLLSQTRSAWAGLVAAALVFGWLWLRRSPDRPYRWRVILIPILVLMIGLDAAWFLAGPTDQRSALTSRTATLTALSQDEGWQGRLEIWHGTGRLIAAHPIIGIGLGRYPSEQWRWTHAGGPLAPAAHASLTQQAHSFYLQTASEIGGIGLCLYLAALIAFVAQSVHRLRTSRLRLNEQSIILIASLSALAGQCVDALASPSWQFPEASFFFWTILGLGMASLRHQEPQTAPAPLPSSIRRLSQFVFSGSVAVVVTAQILPIGLLTPVEAYDHLTTSVYQSVAISKIQCPSGTGFCFSLVAQYSTGSQDVTFDDGGLSRLPASFHCVIYPSTVAPCSSSFSSLATRNQLTIKGTDPGKTLTITGAFEDGAYPTSPFVTGKGAYSGRTSLPLYITP